MAITSTSPLVIGRYALFDELAAGGMATVHLGRLLGPVGFGRTVAVKRLHAHYLKDEEFITMFMDEARIVARIVHPNVVPMVDVVQSGEGLFLVMEYVHGESLSRLMRTARQTKEKIPPKIVAAIMCGVLLGLHAAHDTKGPDGSLLGVVHRDVSPQNIIVGSDGSARVLDFGIAKAQGRSQVTREGQIKGKLAYMAPEQIRGQVDRRTDVFAAAVVLWEMLAGRRLHDGAKDVDIVTRVVQGNFPPPSHMTPALSPEIDAMVLKGLAVDPKLRYATARDLALELQKKIGLASPTEVSDWVERLASDVLTARTNLVTAMELASGALVPAKSAPPHGMTLPKTLPIAIPTPGLALVPVELDDPGEGTGSGRTGDVPSSSAVFAHTQPTTPSADPTPRAPGNSRAAWFVLALSAALAVAGVLLGAYALTHRGARQPRGPEGEHSATPSITPAPLAPTASASPSSTPAGTSSVAPAASATPVIDELDRDPKQAPSTTATPATTGGAGSAATIAPTARPMPLAAPKPKARPSCDPPYTVDENGHRHYKAECMGLE